MDRRQHGPVTSRCVEDTSRVRRCDRVWESSLEGGDSVQLPVPQSNIDHLRRAAEEALAAAERQIVHKTGNHAMVDVEVRQAAIESCIVIVDCSLVATARISNAGGGRFLVDCLRPGIHTGQGQRAAAMLNLDVARIDTVSRVKPVCSFVTVTLAPGTTAPVASLMAPVI